MVATAHKKLEKTKVSNQKRNFGGNQNTQSFRGKPKITVFRAAGY